jgi:TRAP-type C4-dicarboxylate transport system permease small subunit
MRRLVAAVGALSRLFGMAASLCLALGCLVVCQMVFMRYVLEASTVWQTEFVLYSIVAATLLGSPYVLLTQGHVNVDLASQYLGPRPKRVLKAIAASMGIAFCLVLALSGWRYFEEAWREGWVTESVWAPPLWAVLLPLPLGMGLLSLQYLVDIACLVTGYDAKATKQ